PAASPPWTPQRGAWGDVRTRRGLPVTSRPRICSICCTGWASPRGSTSRRSRRRRGPLPGPSGIRCRPAISRPAGFNCTGVEGGLTGAGRRGAALGAGRPVLLAGPAPQAAGENGHLDGPKISKLPAGEYAQVLQVLPVLPRRELALACPPDLEAVGDLDDAGQVAPNEDLQKDLIPDGSQPNTVHRGPAEGEESGQRIRDAPGSVEQDLGGSGRHP